MVRRKKTKTAVLVLTAAILIISVVQQLTAWPQLQDFGITKDAPLLNRLTFHFFHANILHATTNAWCLIALTFHYDIKAAELITAFLIAGTFPIDTLASLCGDSIATTPTVGLSAVCYALMGQIFFRIRRKIYYTACVGIMTAIGGLFPNVNTPIHIYCYIAGLIAGALNTPILNTHKQKTT